MSATLVSKSRSPRLIDVGKHIPESQLARYEEALNITLLQYFKGKDTPLRKNGLPAVYDTYSGDYFCIDGRAGFNHRRNENENPDFIITPDMVILLNGDEFSDDKQRNCPTHPGHEFPKSVTLSFKCLSRLLFGANKSTEGQKIANMLERGTLVLLDRTSDSRKSLSTAELQMTPAQKRKLSPPEAGYTLVNDYWHRSATTLWAHTSSAGRRTFLLGQDEGTYFGVEFPSEAKTIQGAYRDLMPKEARNKSGVLRHGEWFFIPVDDKMIPDEVDCVCTGDCDIDDNNSILLPRDTPNSNYHIARYEKMRVGKNGNIYLTKATIVHETADGGSQHADLKLPVGSWYLVKRNTATQSFSEAGVD